MNNLSTAIITNMHNYVPMYDHRHFDVILNYFMYNFNKWNGEVDKLYLLDSNWDIKLSHPQVEVIKTNPNLRYYEAYGEVLLDIDADMILFMDNDMVIYRPGIVKSIFEKLGEFDVVSIYDTIGEYKTNKLNGKNKFCPYLFATRKELLMKYLDVDWGPNLPEYETLGALTREMLDDGVIPYEWEEDKNSIYFDGAKDGEMGKDIGTYHIRAGSVPAYLLTHKHNDGEKYWEYLRNQPKREYLRQSCWYQYMGGNPVEIYTDVGVTEGEWAKHYLLFKKYHNLP